MHLNQYNPSVRVGNWAEDIAVEEEALKSFWEKREKGQLNIQQNFRLLSIISAPQELSMSKDGYVHFGDLVCLYNKKDTNIQEVVPGERPRKDGLMALNFENQMIFMKAQEVKGPCLVTCSSDLTPTIRTTYEIVSCDGSTMGEPLQYRQHFMLRSLAKAGCLYLYSDYARQTRKSKQQEVSLVVEPSFVTEWMVIFKPPAFRMEMEGMPVKANTEVVIRHCKTGLNLCVEPFGLVDCIFGMEPEVTCHNQLNGRRLEKPVNLWELKMRTPGMELGIENSGLGDSGLENPAEVTVECSQWVCEQPEEYQACP